HRRQADRDPPHGRVREVGKRRRAKSQPSAIPASDAKTVATPATFSDNGNGGQSTRYRRSDIRDTIRHDMDYTTPAARCEPCRIDSRVRGTEGCDVVISSGRLVVLIGLRRKRGICAAIDRHPPLQHCDRPNPSGGQICRPIFPRPSI
ncbi:hypothetical protein, partial [Burkholderia oklahomensis]|uniref:hypothetical protein n=1 Tax=Burkholderia oklahomensis TaxID=342113 RepID=UPI001E29D86E